MFFSEIQANLALENDPLVMRGPADKSTTGCVLRGVLNIHLKQPAKIHSIVLLFSGTLVANWVQLTLFGHLGPARHYQSLITHRWVFLPPQYADSPHLLPAGDHAYDFELPLKGDLPTTCQIENHYIVHYQLKATIQRPYFLSNIESQRDISIIRPLHAVDQPITVDHHWRHKLIYTLSVTSNVFHHGGVIPVTIHIFPRVKNLNVSLIDCRLKENASCEPKDGLFNGDSIAYSHTVFYHRANRPPKIETVGSNDSLSPWAISLPIPVPKKDIQYDTKSDGVCVDHSLEFTIYIETQFGQTPHRLGASLPILIQPKPRKDILPNYYQTENGKSYPYHPSVMAKLLQHNQ